MFFFRFTTCGYDVFFVRRYENWSIYLVRAPIASILSIQKQPTKRPQLNKSDRQQVNIWDTWKTLKYLNINDSKITNDSHWEIFVSLLVRDGANFLFIIVEFSVISHIKVDKSCRNVFFPIYDLWLWRLLCAEVWKLINLPGPCTYQINSYIRWSKILNIVILLVYVDTNHAIHGIMGQGRQGILL
jgi:hypothetical protein